MGQCSSCDRVVGLTVTTPENLAKGIEYCPECASGRTPASSAPRTLPEIVAEIINDWNPIHPCAAPYVRAMLTMDSTRSNYGLDSGMEIVCRFLCNASQWKGEVARRVKKELKALMKMEAHQC